MEQFSDIHFAILGLLAQCGWVSRPLLELLDYSYTYRTRNLKILLDGQYIRKFGKGRNKAYALTARGRNLLSDHNSCRFSDEVIAVTKQLVRHPERAVQRGDAAAFLSFGGFSVHPNDKPALPAYIPPDCCTGKQETTAINCYYDALSLKELAKDNAGVSYSRVCGVLVTPSCLMRVYHSRSVAMKFHTTGEQNFQNLLLSEKVFTGRLPAEQNAVLILGDDFTAALHVLQHRLAGYSARIPMSAKQRGKSGYTSFQEAVGEMLTPTNLGNPAFYLPLCRDSLGLLRLMAYPFWQDGLVREISRALFPQEKQPRWYLEQDGYAVYILAALNLPQIDLALRMIQGNSKKKARIICLNWQELLFRQLLEPFAGQRDLWLTKLPAGFLDGLLQKYKEEWGDTNGTA